MKLATLALVAATVAIPAAAFADSSQPNSSPGAAAPAGQIHNQGAAMNKNGQMNKGGQAGDSSVPGATNANQNNANMKKGPATTGSKAPASDSSVPGASKH